MWPRTVELMLGIWLMISPWVFGHYPDDQFLWLNDVFCGIAAVVISMASVAQRLRHLHLLLFLLGGWLAGVGYVAGGYPSAPGYTNEIIIGLTLMMFAIIPNQANQPPVGWRAYYASKAAESASDNPERHTDTPRE